MQGFHLLGNFGSDKVFGRTNDVHTLVPKSPPANRPRSVPEVRADWLQIMLADNFKFLRGILLDAEGELRTLENKTGLSVFDWAAHESKILGVKL